MMAEDEALDLISSSIALESWFEGKTLTVMVEDDGATRFVKLRLVNITEKPSAVDLRGEPE